MKWLILLFAAASFSSAASPEMCFIKAGKDYGIDPLLLTAISIRESHLRMDAVNKANSDKTEDVCGMQVNSSHYARLKKFNIDRHRLLSEPCICVYAGAWVLAHNFRSYGRNWSSVGIYNTGPSPKLLKRRNEYASEIKSIYRVLLARNNMEGKNNMTGIISEQKKPLLPSATAPHEMK